MKNLALASALICLTTNVACAQTTRAGDIEISHAWASAARKFSNSAAYMNLTDTGTKPDSLISASSPVAEKVELHVFLVENGFYGMHPVDGFGVMPGVAPTVLQPGGAHLMLEALRQPLKAGESFPLTLTFKTAGKVQLEVLVEAPKEKVGAQASY